MSVPCQSACSPWADVTDVGPPCNSYDFDQDVLETYLSVATDLLFERTGRRWPGFCRETVRPSRGCRCRSDCSCGPRMSITLPGKPLAEIIQVKLDGEILEPSRYRIDDYDRVIGLPDEHGVLPNFPCCQRIDLPTTEVGTMELTYIYGVGPPEAGKQAAASLGCELSRAKAGDAKCRLPARTQRVVRQNVTVDLVPASVFTDGFTGLQEVDLFIRFYNPANLQRAASVWSPDLEPEGVIADT